MFFKIPDFLFFKLNRIIAPFVNFLNFSCKSKFSTKSIKIDANSIQNDDYSINSAKCAPLDDSNKDKDILKEKIISSSDLETNEAKFIMDDLQKSLSVHNTKDEWIKKVEEGGGIKNSTSHKVARSIKQGQGNKLKNDDLVKSVMNDTADYSIKDKNIAQQRMTPSSDVDTHKFQFIIDDLRNSLMVNNPSDNSIKITEADKNSAKSNMPKAAPSSENTIALGIDKSGPKPIMKNLDEYKPQCDQKSKNTINESTKIEETGSLKDINRSSNFFTSFMQKIKSQVQSFDRSITISPTDEEKDSDIMRNNGSSKDYGLPKHSFKDSSTFSASQNDKLLSNSNSTSTSNKKEISLENNTKKNNPLLISSEMFKEFFELFKTTYFISPNSRQRNNPKHITSLKNKKMNVPIRDLQNLTKKPMNILTPVTSNIVEKTVLGDAEFKSFCEEYKTYFTEQREFAFFCLPAYDYIHNGEIKDFDFIFDLVFFNISPRKKLLTAYQADQDIINNELHKLSNLYDFENIQTLDKFVSPSIDIPLFSNDAQERLDFKDHFTFSLDHGSGTITEDVFSYKKSTDSNTEEFGLHAIDIAHVLKDYPDDEKKALFCYLKQNIISSKPNSIFNQNITDKGSLRTNFDYFTLSTIIKYIDGKFSSFWIGKGIIDCNISLTFKAAYKFLKKSDQEYASDDHKKAHQAILAFEKVIMQKSIGHHNFKVDTIKDNKISGRESLVIRNIIGYFNRIIDSQFLKKIEYPIPVSNIFQSDVDKHLPTIAAYKSKKIIKVAATNTQSTHFTSPFRSYTDIIMQKFINIYTQKGAVEIVDANFSILIQLIFWTNIRLLQGFHIQTELNILLMDQEFDADMSSKFLIPKSPTNTLEQVDDTFSFYATKNHKK